MPFRRTTNKGGKSSGFYLSKTFRTRGSGAVSAGNTDPYFNNVSVLLHMDGTNGSTTFTDSSNNALTVTANGNAQISTAESKFGGASGSFDGSGDYLSLASSSVFNVGGLTLFTLEGWIRPSSTSSSRGFFSTRNAAVYSPFELIQYTSGLQLLASNSSVNNWAVNTISAYGLISANTWQHIALVGDGSNLKAYVDGTLALTGAQANWTSQNYPLYIGGGGDNQFSGYMDEVRFTKGVARYTSDFTPPTAAFPNS